MGFNHDYLEFKNLKVRRIDQVAKKIYTEEEEIVEFDYLIMAAGTRTFFHFYFKIKSLSIKC